MSDMHLPPALASALARALDDAYEAGKRDAAAAILSAANVHPPKANQDRAYRVRGRHAAWTSAEQIFAEKMRGEGKTLAAIAAALGRSETQIWRALKKPAEGAS